MGSTEPVASVRLERLLSGMQVCQSRISVLLSLRHPTTYSFVAYMHRYGKQCGQMNSVTYPE